MNVEYWFFIELNYVFTSRCTQKAASPEFCLLFSYFRVQGNNADAILHIYFDEYVISIMFLYNLIFLSS
jgi:hypothetical protein